MGVPLPGEVFALVSAVAWAVSTVVINRGLTAMQGTDDPAKLTLGLAVSLLTGCLVLTAVMLPRLDRLPVTSFLVLAGVCSFPIGTGLYYHTSELFTQKADVAAQFVQSKPVFSVGFALLLGEAITRLTVVALLCILLGLGLLIGTTVRRGFGTLAAAFGLATAFAWALGDAFMKLGLGQSTSLAATYVALLSGSAVYLVIALPIIARRSELASALREPWVPSFVAHGLLSFGLAYTAFYTSIQTIGLGRTALITAFWPVLAIGLGKALEDGDDVGSDDSLPRRLVIPAAILLVVGSFVAVL